MSRNTKTNSSYYSLETDAKRVRVFVAMSGGVDSSVTAALLKEQGYDVAGVHMICWEGCENNQDKQDAMRVAAQLEMPFFVWDFRREYKEEVFNYMVREYEAGRTPNPDVMCNKEIKFGVFLDRALDAGADFVATGHYIKITRAEGFARERFALSVAKDASKDQSYFLWTLNQDQLQHCLFPIGDYLKSEVRELARKFNLYTSEKKDSQGLCFVGNIDFGTFLRQAISSVRGDVVNTDGKKIGEHDGAQFYTVGQRHGLNIGGSPKPLFVAEKNTETNTIVVAEGDEDHSLYRSDLFMSDVHWISGTIPDFPFSCLARIRYRQPSQTCTIHANGKVIFDTPQRAVASGQSIVFYKNDEMLGGGVIL